MENRRDFFALMGAALAAAGSAQPALAHVHDSVRTPEKAEKLEHSFGTQYIYYQGHTDMLEVFESGSLRLSPGMEPHPPHKHPDEEILLVTEGEGEISIDGEVTKAGPGAMMYTGSNKMHGIVNTGSEPMLFYYFKWVKKA